MSDATIAAESGGAAPKIAKISEAVIRIAGNSQDGIQAIGGFLARLAGRSEQEVMTFMTIPSTISGGPSIFQVRIGSGEVLSSGDDAAVCPRRSGRGSGGEGADLDQVVGEYPVSAPDRGSVPAVQEGAVPAVAAFEVADPAFASSSPLHEPAEAAAVLDRLAVRARWRPGGGSPRCGRRGRAGRARRRPGRSRGRR